MWGLVLIHEDADRLTDSSEYSAHCHYYSKCRSRARTTVSPVKRDYRVVDGGARGEEGDGGGAFSNCRIEYLGNGFLGLPLPATRAPVLYDELRLN